MLIGNSTPSNTNTNELDLNNGGWVIIIVLSCIILAILIIFFVRSCLFLDKIDSLKKLLKNELNDSEMKLILTYRNLNYKDKIVINDTLKTLSKNHEQREDY